MKRGVLAIALLVVGALLGGVLLTTISGIPQEWLLYSNFDDAHKTQITGATTLSATIMFPDDGRPTRFTRVNFVVVEADGTAIRCTDSSWSNSGLHTETTRDGEFIDSTSTGCNGLAGVGTSISTNPNPIYDYQDAPGHTYVFTATIATPPAGEIWYWHADIGGTNPIGVCAVNPSNCIYQDALQRTAGTPAVAAGGTTVVAPVTASFTWTSEGNGLIVRFVASATTDSVYQISKYVWNFGDGTPELVQEAGSSFGTAPHIYAASSTYTVTLTVFDSSPISETRKASVARVVTVTRILPGPLTGSIGTDISKFDVQFTLTVSGGEGTKSYAWDFGDGDTSTVQSPTHTYSAGTYDAKVTISDASGSIVVTKTVTVTGEDGDGAVNLLAIALLVAGIGGIIGGVARRGRFLVGIFVGVVLVLAALAMMFGVF